MRPARSPSPLPALVALALAALAAPAGAQDEAPADRPPAEPAEEVDPVAPPTPAPADPAAEQAAAERTATERRLRRENGALLLRVAREAADPPRETARLRVEVLREGTPIDRTRELDVSIRRGASDARGAAPARTLRVRFREPPALRGQAWLVEVAGGAPGGSSDGAPASEAWRYDPQEHRVARAAPPEWSERVAGTGLRWVDLLGPPPLPRAATLEGDARLRLPHGAGDDERAVHVVTAAGAVPGEHLRIHVDVERRVALLVEVFGPGDTTPRELRWLLAYRRVGGRFRPMRQSVVEPGRLSLIEVVSRGPEVPDAHFDRRAFWREDP